MKFAELEPHQQRVVIEAVDLLGKLERLHSFIEGKKFGDLDAENRFLLENQMSAMTTVLGILTRRLQLFGLSKEDWIGGVG